MKKYKKFEKKLEEMFQDMPANKVRILVRNYFLAVMSEKKSKKTLESKGGRMELYLIDSPMAYLLGYSSALLEKISEILSRSGR